MSGKAMVKIEGAYAHKSAEEVVTKSGKSMAKFAVTTSDDKKVGDKWERGVAKWWNCIAFDTNAQKALDILTGAVRGVNVEGRLTVEDYNGKTYEKVIVDHISLADGQTAHGQAKANGYAPEPVPVEEHDDDLCPF